MVEDTEAQVAAEVPPALVPDTEVQAKALENRTTEAVRLTGISREDGHWKQVPKVHPKDQNNAKFKKGTDGNWYEWSAKIQQPTSVLGETLGEISGGMEDAVNKAISSVASFYQR